MTTQDILAAIRALPAQERFDLLFSLQVDNLSDEILDETLFAVAAEQLRRRAEEARARAQTKNLLNRPPHPGLGRDT